MINLNELTHKQLVFKVEALQARQRNSDAHYCGSCINFSNSIDSLECEVKRLKSRNIIVSKKYASLLANPAIAI